MVNDALQKIQAGTDESVISHINHAVDSVNGKPHVALSVTTEQQTYTGQMFIGNKTYKQKSVVSHYRDDGPKGLVTIHPVGVLYNSNGNNVGDPVPLIKQQHLEEDERAKAAAEGRAPRSITYNEALQQTRAGDKQARCDFYRKQAKYTQQMQLQSAAQQAPG